MPHCQPSLAAPRSRVRTTAGEGESTAHVGPQHTGVQETEKCTARRWKAGPQLPSPLLLLLSAAVAQHSLLAFLTFEDVMDLRAVSRALQPLMEAAAVAQLNRLCPSGLFTIARLEYRAKQRIWPLRKKKSVKRRRADGSAASVTTAKLTPSVSEVSSATSSSTSPPSSPSPSTPLLASSTLVHAVWAMREVQWCRRLP